MISKYSEDFSEENQMEHSLNPLRAISNIGGYSVAFLPGSSPTLVLKESCSLPRALNLRGSAVRSFSGFNTNYCREGFIYVDVGVRCVVKWFRNQ